MFRDTLLAASGQKCLVLPFDLAGNGQKVTRKLLKSAQYTAFLSFIDAENVLFEHFLDGETDSGGPTH